MVLHRFTVVVEDKAGVLARVTALLGARGENIQRLSAVSEAPARARIIAEVAMAPYQAEFVRRKLSKLVYVLEVKAEVSPGANVITESLWPTGALLRRYAEAAYGNETRISDQGRRGDRVAGVTGGGAAVLQNSTGMV